MNQREPRRYGTERWGRLRAAQLRLEPLCRLCKAIGRIRAATVADHVTPHRGNEYAFWNGALQSLCATCHSAIKQSLEKTGVLRGAAADGRPLDPGHHWNQAR